MKTNFWCLKLIPTSYKSFSKKEILHEQKVHEYEKKNSLELARGPDMFARTLGSPRDKRTRLITLRAHEKACLVVICRGGNIGLEGNNGLGIRGVCANLFVVKVKTH